VLFIVENNGYARSTSTARGLANPRLADRAAAYAMPGVTVDGNDFAAVRDAVAAHAATARNGGGPALIECVTYRMSGHSRGDPRVYRTREEEAAAQQGDPILRLETQLQLTAEDIAAHRQRAQDKISAAIRFCESSPDPDPAAYIRDATGAEDLFS
jgi:pyruvate dehydrogenase E1 component alpha subunit